MTETDYMSKEKKEEDRVDASIQELEDYVKRVKKGFLLKWAETAKVT